MRPRRIKRVMTQIFPRKVARVRSLTAAARGNRRARAHAEERPRGSRVMSGRGASRRDSLKSRIASQQQKRRCARASFAASSIANRSRFFPLSSASRPRTTTIALLDLTPQPSPPSPQRRGEAAPERRAKGLHEPRAIARVRRPRRRRRRRRRRRTRRLVVVRGARRDRRAERRGGDLREPRGGLAELARERGRGRAVPRRQRARDRGGDGGRGGARARRDGGGGDG